MDVARALRYLAFGAMALFGLLGSLFVLGYAFADLDLWLAVVTSVAWVGPMVALAVLAVRRPDRAVPVLLAATGAVAAFSLLDHAVGIVPRDDWGPVTAVAVFATGVALAFLGLRRALLAGVLMVGLALVQLLAVTLVGIGRDGPPFGASLGGSSGVMIVPVLAVGALFVVSGLLGGEHLHRDQDRPHPDVPAGVS